MINLQLLLVIEIAQQIPDRHVKSSHDENTQIDVQVNMCICMHTFVTSIFRQKFSHATEG